jgi:polysaccharide chain length determinant protein (PEP-CTERM system associated)
MKDFKKLNVLDYLGILRRRKWYLITVFVLVGTGTGVYAWRLPLTYRSEARIVAEGPAISEEYVRQTDRMTADERMNSVRMLVQSRSFLERMVEELQMLGSGGKAPALSMEEAVNALKRRIQVATASGSVVILTYSATDPQQARDVLKAIADRLVQANVAQRRTKAVETDLFVEEQLRLVERELAEHEQKVKEFKLSHLGELPEQGTANMNALSGLHAQLAAVENALERARDQKRMLEFRNGELRRFAALAQTRAAARTATQDQGGQSSKTDVPPQLAAKKTQLAELMARYTSRHPDVVRLAGEIEELESELARAEGRLQTLTPLSPETESGENAAQTAADPSLEASMNSERAKIKLESESVEEELAKRQKERQEVLKNIRVYQDRLNIAPSLEQELEVLARAHEILKTRYTNLQNKRFQSQMTANVETSHKYESYRILDEPNFPTKPAFPNRIQIILIGLGVSLVLGVGAALGREFLDSTLSSEAEASSVLNLPILVSVPDVQEPRHSRRKSLRGAA